MGSVVGIRKATVSSMEFSLVLLGSLLSNVFAFSNNWVEIARFTENEYIQTESFKCDYVEWRIRWNFSTVFRMHQRTLGIFGMNVFEKERKSLVSSFGGEPTIGSENGILSLSENGTFFLQIFALNINDYSIIIEQNIESIPEFPSCILLSLFLIFSFSIIILRKNNMFRNCSK